MVVGQRFGQFESSVIIVGDDAGDRPDLFENGEVAIQARLGQVGIEIEDLGDRHRARSVVQRGHHPSTAGGVPVVTRAEQPGNVIVQEIGAHGREATVSGNR